MAEWCDSYTSQHICSMLIWILKKSLKFNSLNIVNCLHATRHVLIAQLVERWTVVDIDNIEIHRSLVQIQLESFWQHLLSPLTNPTPLLVMTMA